MTVDHAFNTVRRNTCILRAVEQGEALPCTGGGDRAKLMTENMAQRLEGARGSVLNCFCEHWPFLGEMKGGARVLTGAPKPAGVDERLTEMPTSGGGPPLFNLFGNRGSDGLLWMTSIPADDFESSVAEEPDWQALCDNRLAFGLAAHAEMIDSDLGRFQRLGLDDPVSDLPCLSYDGLVGKPPSAYLFVAATGVRSADRFAAYLQIETFWHP